MSSEILHDILIDSAEKDAGRVLVTFTDGQAHTRGGLLEISRRFAGGLRERGVGPGDHVVLMLDNNVELLAGWFAASMLGAVSVPINTAMRGASLAHQLGQTEPVVVICEARFTALVQAALESLSLSPTLIVRGAPVEGHDSVDVLHEAAPLTECLTRAPKEAAVVMYTSGSTGPPKGAVITYRHMMGIAESVQRVLGYTPDDVAFTCLPLFHANALLATFLTALVNGAPTVVAPRFSATRYWEQVRETGATITSMLGSMSAILWKADPAPDDADNPLVRVLCIPFPDGHFDEVQRRFGVTLTSFFGVTELGVPIGVEVGARAPAGSCGRVLPGWTCRLVDDDDEEVPAGEVGELVIRPDRPYTTLLGYLGMPDATLRTLRNVWLHTGDYLRRDTDGWFWFVDRRRDAIRRSGENISTYEIETALLSHPAVADVAAFGVPSTMGEEEVMVAVVRTAGQEVLPEELLRHCEGELPYYAVPRYVDFVDALPKTENERIMRQPLRDRGVTAQTWDAGPRGLKSRDAS